MRHLQTYENLKEPKLGDYVIVDQKLQQDSNSRYFIMSNRYKEFINNTPGRIVKIVERDKFDKIYIVNYDDMPLEIDKWLDYHGSRNDGLLEHDYNERKKVRFLLKDIAAFSSDKESVIINKDANKFNL